MKKHIPQIIAMSMATMASAATFEVKLTGEPVSEPGAPPARSVLLTNPSAEPVVVDLAFSIQRNSQNWEWRGGDAALPDVGESVVAETFSVPVPAGGTVEVARVRQPLTTGAYRLAVRASSGDAVRLAGGYHYVFPPALATLPADSPFGMNGASFDYPSRNRELGVGWMRFENMKWNMSMPEAGRYAFDGSVAPWRVDHDTYLRKCREQGMKVLPYTFQTPRWLSRAPEGTKKNIQGHPPKDFADYGEMMFQLAARYGRVKHPAAVLKTPDRLSGLGLLDVYQLWNEPNLEGPDWAPWVGSMAEYYEIFRIGSEAVKRADPAARVATAGIAGIGVDKVDGFYRYRYADGRRPVDFADILCVHYYSGKQQPEIATLDRNATRSGEAAPGAPTYPESLRQLMDWRDDFAPGKPIWMTETGNDVGGPMGLGEWEQGAKIPRTAMLALAAGVDKVFIYRECGSTPAQHAGSGLMREDGTHRASWFTFATLIRQFVGVAPGCAWRIAHPDPDVWIHAWVREGKPLITAWTVGEEAELGLDLGMCEVVDAFGHAVRRETKTLRLGAYPQYISAIKRPDVLAPLVKAARQQEAERQAVRKREAGRRAMLFDFGPKEHVAVQVIGNVRSFQPVLAADRYDAVRGWGFEGKGAVSDQFSHWIPDLLRKDCVRLQVGGAFRFRVEAGRYRVCLQAQSMGGTVEVTLRSSELLHTWAVGKPGKSYEAELTHPGGDLWIEANGWVELQGLSLIAVNPES